MIFFAATAGFEEISKRVNSTDTEYKTLLRPSWPHQESGAQGKNFAAVDRRLIDRQFGRWKHLAIRIRRLNRQTSLVCLKIVELVLKSLDWIVNRAVQVARGGATVLTPLAACANVVSISNALCFAMKVVGVKKGTTRLNHAILRRV